MDEGWVSGEEEVNGTRGAVVLNRKIGRITGSSEGDAIICYEIVENFTIFVLFGPIP